MARKKQVSVCVAGGIIKKLSLPYTEEKTPFGIYKLLDARGQNVPKIELIKVANNEGIPVMSDYGRIFPEGKTSRDFIKKGNKRK
ncbi:MAG: hypothetical protein D6769_02555 [Methanobacteriota archaeon]|nr:MAG: hypothetical protein D6769_02555 [Euryarchaeota archaeon]